jgi:photosystem II stability/assembly factor-like uncharacterized protein
MIRHLISLLFLCLLISSCESKGDRFEAFKATETVLGSIPGHNVRCVYFADELFGVVVISGDTVLRTMNGCKSFEVSLAKPGEEFKVMKFANDSVGFLSGRRNQLYKTVDRGKSWREVPVEIEQKLITAIFCLNQDTLFISASDTLKSLGGFIAKSVDGGRKWVITPTIALKNLFFFDVNTGFACGDDGVLKTIDGGATWMEVSKQGASEILLFSHDSGYSISDRSLFLTTDGGITWGLNKTVLNRQWVVGEDNSRLECLRSIGEDEILFTLNSRLIKVTDFGKRWFQYDFTKPYNRLETLAPGKGIIYGYEHINIVNF